MHNFNMSINTDVRGYSIDGDFIFANYFNREKEVVGVTKSYYNALLDERDKYFNRLVELNDPITAKPKTAEEEIQELKQMVAALTKKLDKEDK